MISEHNKRLNPLKGTLRYLYLHSGNECAMESCQARLIDRTGAWVGEIAHINAAANGGPRANPSLTPEERRQPDNLMLLCRNCHKKIDSCVDQFPAEVLKEMKKQHENKYRNGLNQALIADSSDEFEIKLPESLGVWNYPAKDPYFPKMLELLQSVADRLALVPLETRHFLVYSIRRSRKRTISGSSELVVPVSELTSSITVDGINIKKETIFKEVNILNDYIFANFENSINGLDTEIVFADSEDVLTTAFDISIKNSKSCNPDLVTLENILLKLDFRCFA